MPGAHATIEVARLVRAPIDRVWDTFTDLSVRAEVMSTVDSVEPLHGDGFEIGTTWRETRTLRDEAPVTEELRVVELHPYHRCVISARGEGGDYRIAYDFTPRDGHTRVHCRFSTAPPQRLAERVIAVFFGGMVTRVIEGALRQDLADLSTAIEAAAA
ncbi:MAG: SRPBCC family protein [Micromonosporaceae bacterium]